MFNQENNVKDYQHLLLINKLAICAEEVNSDDKTLSYTKDCIKHFVLSLSDYDYGYVSNLSKASLDELIELIKAPIILGALVKRQLDLHWIFGYTPAIKGELTHVSERFVDYNAAWGKETTLTFAHILSNENMAYFVDKGIIDFSCLRSWDKSHEMGLDFVYQVLDFLLYHAEEVQSLLEDQHLDKQALHYYFLEQGSKGFNALIAQSQ